MGGREAMSHGPENAAFVIVAVLLLPLLVAGFAVWSVLCLFENARRWIVGTLGRTEP